MTPHYVFWKCTFCEQSYLENDCYGGGKYCAVEPSNEKFKGRDIIQEDLRQKCLYDHTYASTKSRNLWWAYMKQVHQNCYSAVTEECSESAHQKLGIDFEKTKQCVKNSFTSSDWASSRTNNTIIDQEIKYWQKYGSGIYPAIVINNRTYRG